MARQATDSEPSQRRVFRVGELNRAARDMLQERFAQVWVEGELSDVKRHASGHVYFTLNDPREVAQLRGVMFRGDARRSKARLERGEAVRFRGQVSLYPERGTYQLIARFALPAGAGDLHAQFERIRLKLAKEGLLAPERRRPLPAFPRVVGVVTSAHGAAMHDIIRVTRGRFPVRLVVADCRVQGEPAPMSIIEALLRIQRLPGLDVIILARGGGSGEDLWAFNHEGVARTVAESKVPVVTGIGHETDITIADLVADARASTPSNAAELVLPELAAVESGLDSLAHRLERAMAAQVDRGRLRLSQHERRLDNPRQRLRIVRSTVERLERRLAETTRQRLSASRRLLTDAERRLRRLEPSRRLAQDRRALLAAEGRIRQALAPQLAELRERVADRRRRLERLAFEQLSLRKSRFAQLTETLRALDPTRVLARGYAIALADGRALLSSEDVRAGDLVELRLHHGVVLARVERTDPGEEEPE